MTKASAIILLPAAGLALIGNQANAQTTLFSDNFNRPDSRNIQASLTGITDNTGSSLAANGVYSLPWIDPNSAAPTYGVQDGNAANGGGAQILSSQLQLAVGAGTSAAYVNHNFVNSSILSAGGFSVSLTLAGESQSTSQQGGAFAIGMSASEAASVGDAFNEGLSPNPPAPSMTGAFNAVNGIGSTIPGSVASDFWLALRGDGSLAWGGSSGTISGVTGLAKTGIISANFSLSDFNAGTTVSYQVFYNGTSEGTGTFAWSGTDDNYIGLDARDSSGVTMDDFSVSTAVVPEPSAGALALLCAAAGGLFMRRRI